MSEMEWFEKISHHVFGMKILIENVNHDYLSDHVAKNYTKKKRWH